MDLVVIHGPPGVGKLTTAKELARLTGYKLFDNHASIDVIRRVFDFGDEPFWPLVNRLRYDVIEQAAKRDVSLVFTCAYVHPDDRDFIEKFLVLVEQNGGRCCLVQLMCEMPVLEERVQSEGRANKMHSLEIARADMAKRDYFSAITGRDSLSLDNTEVPARRRVGAKHRRALRAATDRGGRRVHRGPCTTPRPRLDESGVHGGFARRPAGRGGGAHRCEPAGYVAGSESAPLAGATPRSGGE